MSTHSRTTMQSVLLWVTACFALNSFAYSPDVAEFDGDTSIIIAPGEVFSLANGGTIEFWAAADWLSQPDYDPVIVSNTGTEGASLMVAMLRDKQGLGVTSGDQEELVAFDFSDGRLHHVGIVYWQEHLVVIIDGQVRTSTDFKFVDLPSTAFWIGSSNGLAHYFVGAVAGLRLWRAPLTRELLVSFAMQDVLDPDNDHPARDKLAAISDFSIDDVQVLEE